VDPLGLSAEEEYVVKNVNIPERKIEDNVPMMYVRSPKDGRWVYQWREADAVEKEAYFNRDPEGKWVKKQLDDLYVEQRAQINLAVKIRRMAGGNPEGTIQTVENIEKAVAIGASLPVGGLAAGAGREAAIWLHIRLMTAGGRIGAWLAAGGAGAKIAEQSRQMIANESDGILLGVVESGKVRLFRTIAGKLEGHADLIKQQLVAPGAQGFSVAVKNGQVVAVFEQSTLNSASANFNLTADAAKNVITTLGCEGAKVYRNK
jgi:hypothetical protein